MKTLSTTLGVFCGCTAVRWYLHRSSRRDTFLAGERIRLTTLWNTGAAFGLPLPSNVLPVLSGGMLGVIWAGRRRCPLGAGLALGGGLSNLWERCRWGRVYDYLQFPCVPGKLGGYVFNLADLAVFTGGGLLLAGGREQKSDSLFPAR